MSNMEYVPFFRSSSETVTACAAGGGAGDIVSFGWHNEKTSDDVPVCLSMYPIDRYVVI